MCAAPSKVIFCSSLMLKSKKLWMTQLQNKNVRKLKNLLSYGCPFPHGNVQGIIIIIISSIIVFAGVLFVPQPGANHAPGASVTQVNHSFYTLSTFLRIRADPSMQIF